MEKRSGGKSGSIKGNKHRRKSTKSRDIDAPEAIDDLDESLLDLDHTQIPADIDHFTNELSTSDDKSTAPEVPEIVETFTKIIELRIKKYNSAKSPTRFGMTTEDDTLFLDSLPRLSKLKTALGDFPNTSSFNTTNKVLQQAMAFLEEEFRTLVQDFPITKRGTSKASNSFKPDPTTDSNNDEDFRGYSEDNVNLMNKIATAMIQAGYQYECCQVYSTIRKNGLQEQLKKYEFEKVNADDVQKSNWASLEPDITRWVKLVKQSSNVIFPAERKLGDAIFSDNLPVFRGLFINLIRSFTPPLLDFATSVAMSKRKPKRLFKFLEIYEALRDLGTTVDDSDSGDVKLEQSCDLKSEISSASDSIGEGVMSMFHDLENSIRTDNNKTPIQGGAVHPLTRYVMNYIKCACEYLNTLEIIFQNHAKVDNQPSPDGIQKSPLSKQLLCMMDLLDANLETKSSLYKDPALGYVFLMNNGRFVLQIMKGTNEMKQLTGENWRRRKSSDVRHYHKSYQRETWAKLLQCITQEGIQVNGKASRRVLKERFKSFNAMFDEIHKAQSAWVMSDEQLLSEIRVSISALVVPAYRSFVGRYKQQFEGGKSIDKYIKYQPDDIEAAIETLFEGPEKAAHQTNSIQTATTVKQTTGAFKSLIKTYKNMGLV